MSLACLIAANVVVGQVRPDATPHGTGLIPQYPADEVEVPDDVDQLAVEATAIVIATFQGASGEILDPSSDVPSLRTTDHFTLNEVLKYDRRLPEVGERLSAVDSCGGALSDTKPYKIVSLSEESRLLVPGHKYFLYLAWHQPIERFTIYYGSSWDFRHY